MINYAQTCFAVTFLLVLGSIVVTAQDNVEATCQDFIEVAFEEFGQNCAGLENNSICYGFGTVNTTFANDETNGIPSTDLDILTVVGNQSLLFDADNNQVVESIQTAPLRPITGIVNDTLEATPDVEATAEPESATDVELWGLSLVYTSGNIPKQLDEPGIRIMVIGDVRIENAVPINKTFIPDTIIEVTVEGADLFTAPPDYRIPSTVIETVSGEFEADAISPDGEWVRVFYLYERSYALRATAWLQTESLLDNPNLGDLPTLGADYGTPMQELFLSMESNPDDCDGEQTSGILIQGVDGIETDIRINNLPLRLTSSVFIQIVEDDIFNMVTLDGIISILPDTEAEVFLIPGFLADYDASFCLDEEESLGIDQESNDQSVIACLDDSLPIIEPRILNNDELEQYGTFTSLPNNITKSVSSITVITPSGEGDAMAQIITSDETGMNRVNEYCISGSLPDYICDSTGN